MIRYENGISHMMLSHYGKRHYFYDITVIVDDFGFVVPCPYKCWEAMYSFLVVFWEYPLEEH